MDTGQSRLGSECRAQVEQAQFPLNGNAKIDRTALPVPQTTPLPGIASNLDGGEVEAEVAAIWRSVIMVDHIRPDERLFDIGGASLHVAQIHQLVTERFRLPRLRMTDLFAHPTIRTFSAHIRTLRAGRPRGDDAENADRAANQPA
ncbi:phosphopantetheine-binding protein [Streptomyces sp. NPDC053431]|uniref:phosphopantetheine-binding protein n=1 Tax=Streptomyces sp. NPDC053431 TaxID=3365703 RepID=UPI0037D1DDD2